jgi:hypothetical protein
VAAREPAAPAKPNASFSPVEPKRVEKLAPAVGIAAPAKIEPPKQPQPTVHATLEKEDPARVCIRDEQRLAQLRSNPVPEEVTRFQRDLACTRLHAQVPQPTVHATLEKEDPARACIRDEQRLAQLRSNPVPDEITRF